MSSTKIFFSGVENTTYYKAVAEAGVKQCLVSFYYILNRGRDAVKRYKDMYPDMNIMVDSGAHTFQQQLSAMTPEQFDTYAEQYVRWVDENRDYLYAAVELDAEDSVGLDTVYGWQERLFFPLEKSGVRVIYVWHPARGFTEFQNMCKQHQFVGVAGDLYRDTNFNINNILITARKWLTSVHGFGITKVSWLGQNMFRTCDSTTWKAGEMYGVVYVFTGSRLLPITMQQDEERARWRHYYIQCGVDPDKVMARDSKELTKLNLISWTSYMQYLDAQHGSKVLPWDLRPPMPAVIKTLTDEEVQRWGVEMRFSETLEKVKLEQVDSVRNYVLLSSILLNRQDELVRENADLINQYLKPLLDIGMPMSQSADSELIEMYTTAMIRLVMQRASKSGDAAPRTAEDYIPTQMIEERDPTPAEMLLEEDTYDMPEVD